MIAHFTIQEWEQLWMPNVKFLFIQMIITEQFTSSSNLMHANVYQLAILFRLFFVFCRRIVKVVPRMELVVLSFEFAWCDACKTFWNQFNVTSFVDHHHTWWADSYNNLMFVCHRNNPAKCTQSHPSSSTNHPSNNHYLISSLK